MHEYASRRDAWVARRSEAQQRFVALGNSRLGVAALTAVMAWLALHNRLFSAWWLFVPLLLFIAITAKNSRYARERTLAERAVRYYELGLARLEDRWAGTGETGERFLNSAHVYSSDLDVFGRGSLFELTSRARTSIGESTLASWFLSQAPLGEAAARQEAVRELRDELDLRQDIALLGDDAGSSIHIDTLSAWATSPRVRFGAALRIFCLLFSILGIAAIVGFFAQIVPLWIVAAILGCDFGAIFLMRERVSAVNDSASTPARDLYILSLLLKRLEAETFGCARLSELRGQLDIEGKPASRRIAQLERWIDMLDSSDHLLVRAIRPITLWREQVAMGLESWRAHNGEQIPRWLAAVAQFEALSSLGSLAYEHPRWKFPLLVEGSRPVFDASALLHPLIAAARCVPNNVSLGNELQLLIVSGSNMSGKSTLLRSVGLNAVLAWAGAPVAAESLRISFLRLGASLRVVDSLQDNRSRFLAEITRIREILQLAKASPPVLFLLDELLSGTNSHDRRIGAEAIVRGFVEAGAIGLITTHDLALAEVQSDLGTRARNVHFEDQMSNGHMEFDYKLRAGVVTHSNAIELMRAVGLDV